MGTTTVARAAREALGPVGGILPVSFTETPSVGLQREAVGRLERAGYRAAWTNEVVGGKDALVQVAVLLAATERMAFGAQARQVLGPDKLLIIALSVAADADPAPIAATVREHGTAGADHVILMPSPGGEFASGVDLLEQLAPALVNAG